MSESMKGMLLPFFSGTDLYKQNWETGTNEEIACQLVKAFASKCKCEKYLFGGILSCCSLNV